MRWFEPVVLAGRHLSLEPLGEAHAAELRAAADDPAVFAHLSLDVGAAGALERWIAQATDERKRSEQLAFVLRRRADGRLVGASRYMNAVPAHRRLEIGWTWLVRSAWGGPLNTEAKILMLDHAFGPLGAHRVELRTDVLNLRSQAAIAALGATREGVLRRHMIVRDGRVRDTVQYAIVDEDWPAIRVHLEARLATKLARESA